MTPIRRLFVFCPEKNVDGVKHIAENVFQAKSIF
jgi:hypothetical protein